MVLPVLLVTAVDNIVSNLFDLLIFIEFIFEVFVAVEDGVGTILC